MYEDDGKLTERKVKKRKNIFLYTVCVHMFEKEILRKQKGEHHVIDEVPSRFLGKSLIYT